VETVVVPLTQGKVAVIDAEDSDRVLSMKWYAIRAKNNRWYAMCAASKATNGRQILLHRFIMAPPDGSFIDHIDRDGLNCVRSNLRICTNSQNRMNSKVRATNTSGFKGASFHKRIGKWHGQIRMNSRTRSLGYFETAEEAGRAYDTAAREMFGEFARLNFPDQHEQSAR
jgi:hypothetical protein